MSIPKIYVLLGMLLYLVFINIQPAFSDTNSNDSSNPQDTLTVSTDKAIYTDGDKIIVSGQVGQPITGFPVIIRIQTPNGNLLSTKQVDASPSGQYSTVINAGGSSRLEEGTYTIFAQYGIKNISAQTTFDFKKSIHLPLGQSPSTSEQPQVVPSQIPQSNSEPHMNFDLSGNNLFIITGTIIAVIAGITIYFVNQSARKKAAREAMLQWKKEGMMQDDGEPRQEDKSSAKKRDERKESTQSRKENWERIERETAKMEEDNLRAEKEAEERYEKESWLRFQKAEKERAEKESLLLDERIVKEKAQKENMERIEREILQRNEPVNIEREREARAKAEAKKKAEEKAKAEARAKAEAEKEDDNQVKGSEWAYRISGLSKTCSCVEVKSTFRELIKKYDPNRGNIHMTKEEKEAANSKMRDILKAREMINKEKGCT